MNRCSWLISVYVSFSILSCKTVESPNSTTKQGNPPPNQSNSSLSATTVTVDVGTIEQILEEDRLKGKCEQYWQAEKKVQNKKNSRGIDPNNLYELKVLCGKLLFLHTPLKSRVAIPEIFMKTAESQWPDIVGKSHVNLGFIPNPLDRDGFPLGLSPSKTRIAGLKSRNFTCAGCHVGLLPDNRVAIGLPNQNLKLGQFNLVSFYPIYVSQPQRARQDLKRWPKEVQTYMNSLQTQRKNKYSAFSIPEALSKLQQPNIFYYLTGVEAGSLADLSSYLIGRPGQFNAGAPMLSFAEKQPIVSPPQLFGLRTEPENSGREKYGQMVVHNTLESFVAAALSVSSLYPEYNSAKYVDAISAYLRQIKTPKPIEQNLNSALVEKGENLFRKNCSECHDGKNGESLEFYPREDLGSPDVLINTMKGYKPVGSLSAKVWEMTKNSGAVFINNGIKSRRIVGIWARRNLMVNGSVEDLNHLFCLGKTRGEIKDSQNPLTDNIHMDLCENYDLDQKIALREFLKSWH